MGEIQENITIHGCASAREGTPSPALVCGPQEAEDNKERGSRSSVKPFSWGSKGGGTDPTMLQAGAGSVMGSWRTLKGWDLLTFIDL